MTAAHHLPNRSGSFDSYAHCRRVAEVAVSRVDARLRSALGDEHAELDALRTQLRMRVTSRLYANVRSSPSSVENLERHAESELVGVLTSVVEPVVAARHRALFVGPALRYGANLFHGSARHLDAAHRSIALRARGGVALCTSSCLCESLLDEAVLAATRSSMDGLVGGVDVRPRSIPSIIADAARKLRVDAGLLARPDRSADALVEALRRRGVHVEPSEASAVSSLFRYLHGFDAVLTYEAFVARTAARMFGDSRHGPSVARMIERVLNEARSDPKLRAHVAQNVDRPWNDRFASVGYSHPIGSDGDESDPGTRLVRRLVHELAVVPAGRSVTAAGVGRALLRILRDRFDDAEFEYATRLSELPGAAQALAKFINESRPSKAS